MVDPSSGLTTSALVAFIRAVSLDCFWYFIYRINYWAHTRLFGGISLSPEVSKDAEDPKAPGLVLFAVPRWGNCYTLHILRGYCQFHHERLEFR